jgi:hypothetical protein
MEQNQPTLNADTSTAFHSQCSLHLAAVPGTLEQEVAYVFTDGRPPDVAFVGNGTAQIM